VLKYLNIKFEMYNNGNKVFIRSNGYMCPLHP
jgi:hypothetical protein